MGLGDDRQTSWATLYLIAGDFLGDDKPLYSVYEEQWGFIVSVAIRPFDAIGYAISNWCVLSSNGEAMYWAYRFTLLYG